MQIICPYFKNKEVADQFNELKEATSETAAYHIWSQNNGNEIDKAPNGAESILFKNLLIRFGGNRKAAIQAKASIFLRSYTRKHGNWLQGQSDTMLDENGEPSVDTIENIPQNSVNLTEVNYDIQNETIAQQRAMRNGNGDRYEKARKYQDRRVKEISSDLTNQLMQAFGLKWGRDEYGHNVLVKQDDSKADEFAAIFVQSLTNDDLEKTAGLGKFSLREEIAQSISPKLRHKGRVDGTFTLNDSDELSKNAKLQGAANIIMIYLNNSPNDSSFSHEMAHYYIKTFWKTDMVQEALSYIQENYFGGKKTSSHDLEEKLVKLMEQDSVAMNRSISYDKKHGFKKKQSWINKFWNRLSSRIERMFSNENFKIDNQNRDQIVHYCTLAFVVNYNINKINVERSNQNTYQHSPFVKTSITQTPGNPTIVNKENIKQRIERLSKSYTYSGELSKLQLKEADKLFEMLNRLEKEDIHQVVEELVDYANSVTQLRIGSYEKGRFDKLSWNEYLHRIENCEYKDFTTAQIDMNGDEMPDTADIVDPQLLIDMHDSVMAFVKSIAEIINSYRPENLSDTYQEKWGKIVQAMGVMEDIWLNTVYVTTDTIVDQFVDNNVTQGDKETVKKVWKNWLHRQSNNKDISWLQSASGMYSSSNNGIIRMMYDKVQLAEMEVSETTQRVGNELTELYLKANRALSKAGFTSFGNWQLKLMERDNNNETTGFWLRDKNYGQFNADFREVKKRLMKKYKYIVDDDGDLIDEATLAPAKLEQWQFDGQHWVKPNYYKYLDELNEWLGKHCHRRYTKEYYEIRHSVPYREGVTANDPMECKFGYGLSSDTDMALSEIETVINHYLDKCTYFNPNTGKFESRPEKLSLDDQYKLDYAYAEQRALGTLYNSDGSVKTGDQYRMAQEIIHFNAYVSEKHSDFYTDCNRFLKDAAAITNQLEKDSFYKYHSDFGINPYLTEMIYGTSDTLLTNKQRVVRRLKKQLLDLVPKVNGKLYSDLEKKKDNLDFWFNCHEIDDEITAAGKPFTENAFDIETKNKYLKDAMVPYLNPMTNKEAGDFYNFIVNYYIDKVLNGDPTILIKAGLTPQQASLFVIQDINNKSEITSKYNQIRQLLTESKIAVFTHIIYNKRGEAKRVPLSIFTYQKPKTSTFTDAQGRQQPIIVNKPKGKYVTSKNELKDDLFDESNPESRQPGQQYKNDDYEWLMNEAPQELRDYYSRLIEIMKEYHDKLPLNGHYDYRLPQQESEGFSSISRGISSKKKGTNGFRALGFNISSAFQLRNNDIDLTSGGFSYDPAGNIINHIPIRFVHMLEPEYRKYISSDLLGNVTQYVEMAENWRKKSELLPTALLMQKAMSQQYRMQGDRVDATDTQFVQNGVNVGTPRESKNSIKQMQTLIETQFFGQRSVTTSKAEKERKKVQTKEVDSETGEIKTGWKYQGVGSSTAKRLSMLKGIGATLMLGLNTGSAVTGYFDSTMSGIVEAVCGKYYTVGDLKFGYGQFIKYSPAMFFGLEGKKANNKLTAMMRMNRISKSNTEIFENVHHGRLRKFINRHLLMGGFTIGDYICNAIIMCTMYHHSRFIAQPIVDEQGNTIINPGFYTKNQLKQLAVRGGYDAKYGRALWKQCKYTLWDAYEYKGGNTVEVADWAKPYVTMTVKKNIREKIVTRTALYNGVLPTNEVSSFKQNAWASFVLLMRGFMILYATEKFANGNDYRLYTFDENGVREPMTDDQRRQKGFFNLATQEIEYGTARSAFTGLGKLARQLQKVSHLCSAPTRDYSLTELEKYGLKSIGSQIVLLLGLYGMIAVAYGATRNLSDDDDDFKKWAVNTAFLWSLRFFESRQSGLDPLQLFDLITSLTTMGSPMKDAGQFMATVFGALMAGIKTASDAIGLNTLKFVKPLDDTIKGNSAYKGWNRHLANVFKMTPFSNAYEDFSINGVKSKSRYYQSQVPFFNYAIKEKKQPKGKKSKKDYDPLESLQGGGDAFDSGAFDSGASALSGYGQ